MLGSLDRNHKKLKLFYSYSHKDERLKKRLVDHLKPLKREGAVDWDDRKIKANDPWNEQVDHHLRSADIILLLVSSDFLASDYCYEKEMELALTRYNNGDAIVMPVILRPCDWDSTPLGNLNAHPRDGKPVVKWSNKDEALLYIAKQVRKEIDLIQREREIEGPETILNSPRGIYQSLKSDYFGWYRFGD